MTPANPVNVGRLLVYWAVVGGLTAAVLLAPLPHGLWPEGSGYAQRAALLLQTVHASHARAVGWPINASERGWPSRPTH